MKYKQPTITSLVMSALVASDDFMSDVMLKETTGASMNQVWAATHHLRKRNAIDAIINPDGKAWWYATPHTDNRSKTVLERAPEKKPRNRKPGYHRKVKP